MARSKAPFYVADCETDPFHSCTDPDCKKVGCEVIRLKPYERGRVPRPFIWGLYCGTTDEYYEFATFAELCAFVRDKKITVYAHNGGKFDYHYGREEINSDEPIMVINGRLARFKVGQAEFRDSVNILPVRLKDFQKTEIDYNKLEPDVRHLHDKEIKLYLKSDCVNLWNLIDQYRTRFGKGLTQAGASLKVWSKRSGLEIPKQTPAAHAKYRKYYYGGRVECFKSGAGDTNFQIADINSAYPWAMKVARHPYQTEGVFNDRLPPDNELSQCMVTLRGTSQGAFPYRNERGELFFPNDDIERVYHISGHELQAALEFNAVKIKEVQEVYNFGEGIDFAEYIDHFYKERMIAKSVGDKAGDIFAKLFMNSLYGKFGAAPALYEWTTDANGERKLQLVDVRYQEYLIATTDSVIKWEDEGFKRYKQKLQQKIAAGQLLDLEGWGDDRFLMCRDIPEEKHTFYNVATAASITGYVRAFLFRSLRRCGGVIYCDTDSIAAEDISRLDMGGALGQWKPELTCDRYAVGGKKLYAFRSSDPLDMKGYAYDSVQEKSGPWKRACKGVNLTPQQIEQVALGQEISFIPTVPTYSIARSAPRFIPRAVVATHKERSYV